jgi:very-short-patch-repair endonuclease
MKLAVELDGGQHNQYDSQEYDTVRSEYLKAQGIEVMRFWNHEVLIDTGRVLTRLAERVTPPNLPLT